jgi:hypothetical protein
MKHFLITRFNISTIHTKDKLGEETLTDAWMINRFILFERYLVPGVLCQSFKDFIWLVLFDANTPERFIKKINTYKLKINNFVPVYLNNPFSSFEIKNSVQSYLNSNDQFIITTRVDNDDAIHKDFMLEVQKLFKSQNDCFIRFLNGFQWNDQYHILQKFFEKSGNHFSSRIEKVGKEFETVINVDNTTLDNLQGVEIIDVKDKRKRLWIEVVHERNITNHLRVLPPILCSRVLKDFSLDYKVNIHNSCKILLKYLKNRVYMLLSFISQKIGIYQQFKKLINSFKNP